MIIGIAYDNGNVTGLNQCKEFLLIQTEGQTPVSKRLVPCQSATDMLKLMSMEKVSVMICGALGLTARNALEMLGILLIPGVEGSAEEAAAKFLVGEKQGDSSILEIAREDDPDDPMACMHDCARCAGCGPITLLNQLETQ